MDSIGRTGRPGFPLPASSAAAPATRDANLAAQKSEALTLMENAVAQRLSAAFEEVVGEAPQDFAPTEDRSFESLVDGEADHFASGPAAAAASAEDAVALGAETTPEEDAIRQKLILQPDLQAARTRSLRPMPEETAGPVEPAVDPQEFASLAEGIVPFAMESLLNRVHRDESRRRRDAAKFVLLILKAHGTYVYEHCTRLVDLALALSRELGLGEPGLEKAVEDGLVYRNLGEVAFFLTRQSPRQRDALAAYLAGVEMAQDSLLHDVGKIQVPPEVLYKPAPLSESELRIMRKHPVWGAEILSRIPPLAHAVPVTRHHHERFDGEGYPDGLRGAGIPLEARVVSVVDAFDALVSDRPYRDALPLEEAIREIEGGLGTQFDPDIGRTFLRIVGRVWSPERQY